MNQEIWRRAAAALTLAILLAGCDLGTARIGEVTQGGASFEGREVVLRGTVTGVTKLPLIETKNYRLKDATGEITVWTTADAPREGEEIVVRGRVESIAIVSGESYGLAVKEIERRPPGLRLPWQ